LAIFSRARGDFPARGGFRDWVRSARRDGPSLERKLTNFTDLRKLIAFIDWVRSVIFRQKSAAQSDGRRPFHEGARDLDIGFRDWVRSRAFSQRAEGSPSANRPRAARPRPSRFN